MGAGSVLSDEMDMGDQEEERSRLRRKLEHLEQELRAAELVTRRDASEDNINNEAVKKRVSSKRPAPARPHHKPVQSVKTHSREDLHSSPGPDPSRDSSDNCIMCIQERRSEPEHKRGLARQQRCSREQRTVRRSFLDTRDNKLQRSQSDAQDSLTTAHHHSDNNTVRNKLSSKIIKRSMSFNRIFNNSMLGRSKEYRL